MHDPTDPNFGKDVIHLDDGVVNNLIGMQIGGKFEYHAGERFKLYATPKFGLYDNIAQLNYNLYATAPNGVYRQASSQTTVIDTQKRTVVAQVEVGTEPEGMAISPDGKWAINTSETSGMVHWIDTKTYEIVDNTPVPQRPRYAQFDKSGAKLWISSEIGGAVTVLDVATRQPLKTIDFSIRGVPRDQIQPVGIKLTSDGRYAFVALGPASHVAVIDARTYEVVKYIVTGRRVWHLAFSADESRLFTTNGLSGDVTVIDTSKLTAIKSIRTGRYPWGVVVLPSQ